MCEKDDGSYDSLTRWDEALDFTKNKIGQRSPQKREAKEAHQKKEKN